MHTQKNRGEFNGVAFNDQQRQQNCRQYSINYCWPLFMKIHSVAIVVSFWWVAINETQTKTERTFFHGVPLTVINHNLIKFLFSRVALISVVNNRLFTLKIFWHKFSSERIKKKCNVRNKDAHVELVMVWPQKKLFNFSM